MFWTPKPPTEPQEDDDEIEDYDKALDDYRKALRRHVILSFTRVGLVALGALGMLLNILFGIGGIDSLDNFAVMTAVYGVFVLFFQRSEANRRIATMLIMSPLWLVLIPRYAAYREFSPAADWGILAALIVNYVFWLLIGRRYPVGSSDDIKVWGMDS